MTRKQAAALLNESLVMVVVESGSEIRGEPMATGTTRIRLSSILIAHGVRVECMSLTMGVNLRMENAVIMQPSQPSDCPRLRR